MFRANMVYWKRINATVKKGREGMKQAIKLPIGVEDFRKLRTEGYYFVDKTRFIRALLAGHADVTLFARPRRFGKTLSLSMVEAFFSQQHRDEAMHLFAGTEIASDTAVMREAGSKPVLFLSLKDIEADHFTQMLAAFARKMAVTYLRFPAIKTSLQPAEQAYWERVEWQQASLVDLQDSLRSLLEFMVRHTGKKVLLLIDEYDAPIQQAWAHGYYQEAIDFFRPFLSAALKTNPALDFALITGVLRIAKESIFSGLNNLEVSTVLSGGYADVFGYTRREVEQIAKDFDCMAQLPEIASWYDGYACQGVDIYNPWSVNNYFRQDCKAAKYWANTSGNTILAQLLHDADKARWQDLQALMDGRSIVAGVDENVIYGSIDTDEAALYTLLLLTGYLKAVRTVDEESGLYELSIPNQEVRRAYRTEILSRFGGGEKDPSLYKMFQAMTNGDAQAFEEYLQKIILRTVSLYDAARPESFYHGLMLGFTLYYEKDYRVVSNLESGYGRLDLALFPHHRGMPGILMEFKAVKQEDKLDAAVKKALTQIQERAYTTQLQESGAEKIWCYGIAFCRKQVVVRLSERTTRYE